MPRVRADDYETKSQAIMDCAAALFAKEGYPSAKMQDIAQACGATKSMLYHYFPTKDDLLSAMLEEHLLQVLGVITEAVNEARPAKDRFLAFVQLYAEKSAHTRRRNVTAMNDVKFLPKPMQTPLLNLERQVITVAADLLRELNAGLPDEVYKPYAMLLLGMLNWTDYWFKPTGQIKPQELSERICRLFLRGFLAEKA